MGRQKKKRQRKKVPRNTSSTSAEEGRPEGDSSSSNVCSRSEVTQPAPEEGAVGGLTVTSHIHEVSKSTESGYNSTAESHSEKLSVSNHTNKMDDTKGTRDVSYIKRDEICGKINGYGETLHLSKTKSTNMANNSDKKDDLSALTIESETHNLSTASFVTANEETPNISAVNLDTYVNSQILDSKTSDENNNRQAVQETSESEIDTPRLLEHVNLELANTEILQSNDVSDLDTPRLLAIDNELNYPDSIRSTIHEAGVDKFIQKETIDVPNKIESHFIGPDSSTLSAKESTTADSNSIPINQGKLILNSSQDGISVDSFQSLLASDTPDGRANFYTFPNEICSISIPESLESISMTQNSISFRDSKFHSNKTKEEAQLCSGKVTQNQEIPCLSEGNGKLSSTLTNCNSNSHAMVKENVEEYFIGFSPKSENRLISDDSEEDSIIESPLKLESGSIKDGNISITSETSSSSCAKHASFTSSTTDISDRSVISTLSSSKLATLQSQMDILKQNQTRMEREVLHAKESSKKDKETICSLQKTISLLQDQLVCQSNSFTTQAQLQKAANKHVKRHEENEVISSLHRTIKMLQDQLIDGPMVYANSESVGSAKHKNDTEVNMDCVVGRTSAVLNHRNIYGSTLKALEDINRCISSAIAEDDTFASRLSTEVIIADAIIDNEKALAENKSEITSDDALISVSHGWESSYKDYKTKDIHKLVTDLLSIDPVNEVREDIAESPSCNSFNEDVVSVVNESEAEGPSKWQDLATSYLSADPLVLRLQKSLASAVYYNDNLQGKLTKAAEEVDRKMEEMSLAVADAREEIQKAAKVCNSPAVEWAYFKMFVKVFLF